MNRINSNDIFFTRALGKELYPRHPKPGKNLKIEHDRFRDLFYEYLKPDIIIAKCLGFILFRRENGKFYEIKIFFCITGIFF
jgi:hypothetical protein